MDIGRAIDRMRRARGWTQLELANLSDVSPAIVNRIISGQVSPTLDRLQAFAGAFGVPVYEIIKLAETGKEADARKALLLNLIDSMSDEQIDHAFRRTPGTSGNRGSGNGNNR